MLAVIRSENNASACGNAKMLLLLAADPLGSGLGDRNVSCP